MIHPNVLEEWIHDAHLIVDYEPEATIWDLFKFEYMKLHGYLPEEVELDYPNEDELRELAMEGKSSLNMAVALDQPHWLILEALRVFQIPYSRYNIDAKGITRAFRSGEINLRVLAKRFNTSLYYVERALELNGEKCS